MCPSPVRHINANSSRLLVPTQLIGGCVTHVQSHMNFVHYVRSITVPQKVSCKLG